MDNISITRRLSSVMEKFDSVFPSFCDRKDFENKIEALKKAGDKSNRKSILAVLYKMFDSCGIEYQKDMGCLYYEKLVEKADLPDSVGLEVKLLSTLFSSYTDYPAPEEYMRRIVDRLCDKKDGWQDKSLRVRILLQFIKYGNYLSDVRDMKGGRVYGGQGTITKYVEKKIGKKPALGDVIDNLDDGIFKDFENTLSEAKKAIEQEEGITKEQKKKAREKIKDMTGADGPYGLIKMCDDLANGKFRAEGATKRSLYLFAFVFNMTYYPGKAYPSEEIRIKFTDSDIEKNLFTDYYNNNLIRFITSAYSGKLNEFETDPSGQGINYKNFSEMIYIYFLSLDMSPLDKIRLSSEMINRVQQKGYKAENKSDSKATIHYRNYFRLDRDISDMFCEDILSKTPAEFEEFILENYDCDTFADSYETPVGTIDRKIGALQVENSQRNAYHNYGVILKALENCGADLAECNYGLWFTDVYAFKREKYRKLWDRFSGADKEKFSEFLNLLEAINGFLQRPLDIPDCSKVTRTAMITAYYYYYNAKYENTKEKKEKLKNFKELYLHFSKGLNKVLEASYYQPLNFRNIFDVAVVFSSYAYLNL